MKRPWAVSALYVLFVLVVGFVLIATTEFALSHVPWIQSLGSPNPEYDTGAGHLGDYAPNQRSLSSWKIQRPFRYTITAEGFRTTFQFNLGPTRKAVRIVCLGGSFTFGSYVNDDQPFPYHIGRHFNSERVEVVNAGFGGYSIKDELDYWTDKGRRLRPDLLVLTVYVGHDFLGIEGSPSRSSLYGSHAGERVKRYLSRYAFYNLLVYTKMQAMIRLGGLQLPTTDDEEVLVRGSGDAEGNAFDTAWPEYAKVFRTFAHKIRSESVPLLVVLYPHFTQVESGAPTVAQRRLIDLCAVEQVACLDLQPALKAEHERGVYQLFHTREHVSDDHPTAAGHQFAAHEIYRFLASDSRFSDVVSRAMGQQAALP